MKAYPNMSLDYILYELSYVNAILYSSILPSYDSKESGKQKGVDGKKISADVPENRSEILRILSGE